MRLSSTPGTGRPAALTRRAVLARMGAVGGSAAVFHAATAMGLLAEPAPARPFAMPPPPDGRQPKVAVLGAGIGGLSAAYEVERAGYAVEVLEASHRIGGRNFTVRHGTVIDELGNRQVCAFDDAPHLYFNAGPARIPGAHRRLLHYCRTLQVALEPFINVNYNALVQDNALNGGRPVMQREFIADARGFMAELMAKSIEPARIDAPLTEADLERLHAYLRRYGDLDEALHYRGSDRAGYARGGMLAPGVKKDTLDFRDLLQSQFSLFGMVFSQGEFQAPSLMQPVGGMDRIVAAFVRAIRTPIRTRAIVQAIHNTAQGVEIRVSEPDGDRLVTADYCLNAIPGHLVQGLDTNFDVAYRADIARITRGKLSKIGLQMRTRFWEDEGIYGGISWTNDDVLQIWYPSHAAHRDKGVLLGGYIFFDEVNARFGRMGQAERLAMAVAAGEKVHPGQYRRNVETGVTLCWHRMNHLLGCGGGIRDDQAALDRLYQPHGRHYLIGDQVSLHPGWQEGALASTHQALAHIAEREAQAGGLARLGSARP
ncbi:hypothetical protein CCR85_14405 [Rhodothalassium salexigens]|uniref:flavin monoamine oxidase family protein n=1 Tax=Rhodothalassium salexigens TaxID=1086 RepID=UPI001911D843|nr:FAD-dependent oxidoreductase [Rhodothalassium salexigens]MBK5912673.1 hypothetical protein [Rhodothalassium salexigens]MBK5920806.1 hypothetical protein [Rhodothalassium salexigens]